VRIVLDTNVLFSAFVAHGVCAGLYEECLQQAQLFTSPFILAELREKLVKKAKLTAGEAGEVIDAVRADAELVDPLPLAKLACRDPDDDWILATAVAAQADALVTGDKDLLVLKKFQGIPILTPRDCLVLFSRSF
jgi:putative PIN family toxin of toxin-antitoxin system